MLTKFDADNTLLVMPDTLVGTDSHTTMINGLGVLGWGVGGIEAEAVMLGQPLYMLMPAVVGFEMTGRLPEGATATDLVLTATQMLRRHGVVGKFVEFYGPAVPRVPLADRATIGNMTPEYGATATMFPIDEVTLDYLRLTGRSSHQIRLVEAYAKEQGLWHDPGHQPDFSHTLELDLSQVEPSIAGPKRPQDRIPLRLASRTVATLLDRVRRRAVDGRPAGHQTGAGEAGPGRRGTGEPDLCPQQSSAQGVAVAAASGAVTGRHRRRHQEARCGRTRLRLQPAAGHVQPNQAVAHRGRGPAPATACLLYTSDAADE